MELLDLYKSILKFAGMDANPDGFISTGKDGTRPTIISDKRLVLPTEYQLRNPNPKEKMVFHPLSEDVIRGESEVVSTLKHNINIRLNAATAIVADTLLRIVASPSWHSRLSPEQSAVLLDIKESDEKAVKNFSDYFLEKAKESVGKIFLNIYLRKGGTVKGQRYAYAGIVTFPFYQSLKDGTLETKRTKDKEIFRQLMEYIFPGIEIENTEEYNQGSNSQDARCLDSLMKTSGVIASRLNEIMKLYEEFIDEEERMLFDMDWTEAFNDLSIMRSQIRLVPPQAGNSGQLENQTGQVQKTELQQPVQQAPAKPEVKSGKGGLNFESLMQARPQMAAAVGMMPYQQTMQQMAPGPRTGELPSWARPDMQAMAQQMSVMVPTTQGLMPLQNALAMGLYMMTPNGPMPVQNNMYPNQGMQQQGWGYPPGPSIPTNTGFYGGR
jgi:hypothetical protein